MTYLLNLLDLTLTLLALRLGCTELNPLMQSVPVLVAYKVIVVGRTAVVAVRQAGAGGKDRTANLYGGVWAAGRVPRRWTDFNGRYL